MFHINTESASTAEKSGHKEDVSPMTIPSSELIEFLRKFEEMSPMKCCIIETDAEYDAAVASMKAKGLRIAAISNAGLPEPKRRLTFLPDSAFIAEASSVVT